MEDRQLASLIVVGDGAYGERFNEHAVSLEADAADHVRVLAAVLPRPAAGMHHLHHVDTSLLATKLDAAFWRKVEIIPVSSWPAGVTGCYQISASCKRFSRCKTLPTSLT